MSTAFVPIHMHNHFFQKSTQELLAIAICGSRRRPDSMQIGTERENFLFLGLTQRARALFFSLLELRFGRSAIVQAFFPLGFEPTRYEPIFGFHRTILTLRTFGFVTSTFYRQAPLTERRIVVHF
jgi:hypothetical protein